ncbi:hypothetical protein [Streptomyces chartreusis]|uniref:hypothetical protein n=1 Tax=Streptomyces chartreusis TaxID=1969 RepID=UPI0021011A55|nr:hypothetical protein [Streptomyces chartreusis]
MHNQVAGRDLMVDLEVNVVEGSQKTPGAVADGCAAYRGFQRNVVVEGALGEVLADLVEVSAEGVPDFAHRTVDLLRTWHALGSLSG